MEDVASLAYGTLANAAGGRPKGAGNRASLDYRAAYLAGCLGTFDELMASGQAKGVATKAWMAMKRRRPNSCCWSTRLAACSKLRDGSSDCGLSLQRSFAAIAFGTHRESRAEGEQRHRRRFRHRGSRSASSSVIHRNEQRVQREIQRNGTRRIRNREKPARHLSGGAAEWIARGRVPDKLTGRNIDAGCRVPAYTTQVRADRQRYSASRNRRGDLIERDRKIMGTWGVRIVAHCFERRIQRG